MGHHARTLAAIFAVLTATLVAASTAAAQQSVVRVETKTAATIANAFVDRVAVDTAGSVTITDSSDPLNPSPTSTSCAATSPVAAVISAVGSSQVKTVQDPTTGKWLISSIKGLSQPAIAPPAVSPAWYWRLYVDQGPVDASGGFSENDACSPTVPAGSEVLLYQACGAKTTGCYSGTPLYMLVRDGGPYDIAPQTVPGRGAPVAVVTKADRATVGATVETDEGVRNTSIVNSPTPGQTFVSFTNPGPHKVWAYSNSNRPPARMNVCVSEGNDGYCGSTRVQPPDEIPYAPSPCATNGHDGLCGTVDTSGPTTYVTNIANKKVFKSGKGPGQLKGTIDVDPNGVQDVKVRLTRVVSKRVAIKAKKKSRSHKKAKTRYRTVKSCTTWSDAKALLVSAKCGTKYGQWFTADLSDLRNAFDYDFALTLPRGAYTLEVVARDENGTKDAPAPGRNVLVFTVK